MESDSDLIAMLQPLLDLAKGISDSFSARKKECKIANAVEKPTVWNGRLRPRVHFNAEAFNKK